MRLSTSSTEFTLEIPIAAGGDDVEEKANGNVLTGQRALDLVTESGIRQTVGLRFIGVSVPSHATVSNAYIQFQTRVATSTVTNLTIRGEASDNAPPFTATAFDVSSRPRTDTSVGWSPPPWAVVGEAGENQRTPNLSPVLQRIFNRPGWSSGNALALIITGSGRRVTEAFEGARPPQLHIDYTTPTPTSQPNIVFIVTDDMRTDQLARMPVTNAELVGKGVSFDNAFVSRPYCCPSRASILRGQYSHTTGIYVNVAPEGGYKAFRDRGLEASTIATWLAGAGYRNALIGKYLNEYGPNNVAIPPGWDRWIALDEINAKQYNYQLNVDGTIETFGEAPEDYSTDVFTRYADEFIRTTDVSQPLFLYLSYVAPHSPFVPSPRHVSDGRCAGVSTTGVPSFNEEDMSDKPSNMQNLSSMTIDQQTYTGTKLPVLQCRMLLSVDDGIDIVLRALSDTGRLSNTLIVFTSDHGLFLGEHRLRATKGHPYEEAVHVPYVIRYDPMTGGVSRNDAHLVMNIDLAPTVVDLLGLTVTPGCPSPLYKNTCSGEFDGRSLVQLLDGSAAGWRDDILIEGYNWCSVRTNRYFFTRYNTGEEELYDINSDPYQLTNLLFGSPSLQTQALRDQLFSRLQQLCKPTPPNFKF